MAMRYAPWTPDQQRTTPQARRAAQHPGNGGVPSTVPRVPDAVQRSSRCSAEPGPIQTPSTMDPGPAAHHAAKGGALRSIRGTLTRTLGNGGLPRHLRALNNTSTKQAAYGERFVKRRVLF